MMQLRKLAVWIALISCGITAGQSRTENPISDWQGWWRERPAEKGFDNDILLLTPGKAPGSLRVSGKAYWYGHFSEHFGEVSGEAVPQDGHLHVVEVNAKDEADGCVIDLTLITASGAPTIQADDNQKCGGMNVTFRGVWHRFTPAGKGAH